MVIVRSSEAKGKHRQRGISSPTHMAILVALIGAFVVATFPDIFRPMATGLDPSWVYAINELPYTDAVYGRDVVFSFGPLGYLVTPLDIGSNLVLASGLAIATQVASATVLLHHAWRTKRWLPILAFLVLLILAPSVGLLYEHRLLLTLALLLSISPMDRVAWKVATLVAMALAAVLLFTKLTSGLAAVAMLGAAALTWILQRHVRKRDALFFVGLPLLGMAALLTLVLLGGFADLLEWLAAVSQFTAGYSEAMSYPSPLSVTLLVTGTILVFATGAVLMSRRDPAVIPVALALGVLILLAFRHGIVRHYGRFVPAIVLVALPIIMVCLRSRRGLAPGFVASSIIVVLTFAMTTVADCMCPWGPDVMRPATGWNNLVSVVRLSDTRQRLADETSSRLAEDRLPAEMVTAIRSAGGSVDAIPWEIAFAPANRLDWQPNPVLQTYSAYTASLDRRTADHFRSSDAPDSLLVQFTEIDARHPMLGAPAMWRGILENYAPGPLPIAEGPFGQVALFARRAPDDLSLRRIGRVTGSGSQWIPIPASTHLVFGSIDLRHDLSGRIAALVWRVEPLLIDLKLAEGGVITVRFLPSTAVNGMLLNRLPMTLQELLDFYQGRLPRELVAIRLHGKGMSSFQPTFEIEWFEARWD